MLNAQSLHIELIINK